MREKTTPGDEVDAVAVWLFRIFNDASAGRDLHRDFEMNVDSYTEYLYNWRVLAREAIRLGLRLDAPTTPGDEVDAVAGRLFRIFDDASAGREPHRDFETIVDSYTEYLENWRALAREEIRLGLRLDAPSSKETTDDEH